ncbi:MAG: hypothetical protein NZV14_13740 [Bryobacteraceae bacterium]|nr:hypothetical protein [Bryobacteraceae bacterium]MDW8379221.1 hypothetical protein [Bryobacterales bacterium]
MLVVVGGHSRNIGKTSVMAAIIHATRELNWQAIKVTQHGHGVCSRDGEPCDCEPRQAIHPYLIEEQTTPDGTDSGRYLAAGAVRSWWLRTAQGQLGDAMPVVRKLLGEWEHTIAESNSLLRFLKPDLYIAVLDYAVSDMKESARLFLNRADACVRVRRERKENPWGLPERWIRSKAIFEVEPPDYCSEGLIDLVRAQASRKV